MASFRIALSADFLKPDGSPALADFDLAPLRADPRIHLGYVPAIADIIPASALEDYDALILYAYQMRRSSLPNSRRLGVVAASAWATIRLTLMPLPIAVSRR
jgi:hypothetical protein